MGRGLGRLFLFLLPAARPPPPDACHLDPFPTDPRPPSCLALPHQCTSTRMTSHQSAPYLHHPCLAPCRYGFQPHRIAFWIYWQAVVLLWKGVPLYAPPPFATLTEATKGAQHPTIASQQSSAASRPGAGCPFFAWNPSPHGWPWDSWGASPGALQVQVGQS